MFQPPETPNGGGGDGGDGGTVEAGATRAAIRSVTGGMSKSVRASSKAATKVSIKTVAKLTDRASQALDVHASSEESNLTKQKLSSDFNKGGLQKVLKRFATAGFTFLKNGLAGTVLFEIYDQPNLVDSRDLKYHFLLGGLAGAGYKTCLSGFTILEQRSLNILSPRPLARSLSYHIVGHSLLFGTYETVKRCLVGETEEIAHSHTSDLAFIGVAGGFAGVLHSSFSHYGESLETVGVKLAQQLRTVPPIRSIGLSFVGSCLGFVAFEYGKFGD